MVVEIHWFISETYFKSAIS